MKKILYTLCFIVTSQDSIVCVVTRLQAAQPRVRILAGARDVLFSKTPTLSHEGNPASCSVGTRALSPEVKRPGCEADHLPPSSAKVKNEGSYISTSPVCLHGMYRDSFTFSRLPLHFIVKTLTT
jgi:hypothetical protein